MRFDEHNKMTLCRLSGLLFFAFIIFQTAAIASISPGLAGYKVLVAIRTTNIPSTDTLGKPWQLKKSAFLSKYGTDYTSSTLIRYWLNKRKALKWGTIIGGGAAALVAVPFISVLNTGSAWAFVTILYLGGAITIAGILFLISLPRFIFSSRKKLFLLLQDIKNGKPVPKKYQKKLFSRSN